MTKEERKECREKYYETPKGKEMKVRFLRLEIIGTFGILFSVYLILSEMISKNHDWATYTMAGILMLFSLVFFIGAIVLKRKCFNLYAVKKMK